MRKTRLFPERLYEVFGTIRDYGSVCVITHDTSAANAEAKIRAWYKDRSGLFFSATKTVWIQTDAVEVTE